ncbi:MAG: glycoside hydrolase family 2 TIM barrel-domain containing protein [Candidatus Sigynarchaeum springense]
MARATKVLRDDWAFHLGDCPGAEIPDFKDDEWQIVNVPHDWSIHGKFTRDSIEFFDMFTNIGHRIGYLPQGIGWYRKSFQVPAEHEGKITAVQFDGIYKNADVYINGNHLGFHPYGYTSFHYDLTPYLRYGAMNVLAIRVNNFGISSRWYSGSGIYRKVTITTTSKIHVAQWGHYITTPEIKDTTATVHVRTTIVNSTGTIAAIEIETDVIDNGLAVATAKNERKIPPGEIVIDQSLQVTGPKIWDVETPFLYVARTRIFSSGVEMDSYETPFGIRAFKFDPDTGFYLNGKPLKIKGVCLHHDNGCLGAVEHPRAASRKLRILKEMGCNAIRTSHNPASVEFMDACDREGFLVMNEIFDEWTVAGKKTPYGYWNHFNDWHERDITDFVLRDRNHPCVILWSVGNEVPEQKTKAGAEICKKLAELFRILDPTRPVTSGSNNPVEANKSGYSDHLDVVGYNYYGDHVYKVSDERVLVRYDEEHEKYPKRCMIGSENVSNWATRGVYDFPQYLAGQSWKLKDHYMCSAYDLTSEIPLWVLKTRPYVSGMFTWEGFDYLGEPSPYEWPSRSSNFGIVDLAGFPKDTYYLYQSFWVPRSKRPMVHVMPHWNWDKGTTVPVWVYSNCEAAELLVNGKSLGEQRFAEAEADGLMHLEWLVPFEPGEITAVAKQEGKVMAKKVVCTAGSAFQLKLSADWNEIAADDDIMYITCSVHDAMGNIVPTASNLVTFTVEGPGKVIGVDNGCPIDHQPLDGDQIHAFNGLCLAVIESTGKKGSINVIAASAGLKSATISLKAK